MNLTTILTHIDQDLAYALEETESAYWSHYYDRNVSLRCITAKKADAFLGAIPELDILSMNRVIGLGMRQKVSMQQIEEIIQYYKNAGVARFFVQLSPFTIQGNLTEMLKEKGFRYYNNWSKLMRNLDLPSPEVESGLRIVEVKKSQRETYGKIIFDSFDWEDERLIECLAATVGKPGMRQYLAIHNDKPVAGAALYCQGQYAALAIAGTLAEYRGLGAQSLFLNHRIGAARKEGCKFIIAETAEDTPEKPVVSYRNMRRFGFELAYLRENWIYEF